MIITDDCTNWFQTTTQPVDLTFLDPPFNQGKDYRLFDDNQEQTTYWEFIKTTLTQIRQITTEGGWLYFMQREKNTEFVLRAIREAGWDLKNIIIWKKKTSAVPSNSKFGLHYQIIVSATKNKPRTFNKLRINPPLPATYKTPRENGIYLTDIWDDIRELTSGYFAGAEAIRTESGERAHKQQAPISLLTRIILSSSNPGDTVLDPFAGTGTTSATAQLLHRKPIAIEIDPTNTDLIKERPNQADRDTIANIYNTYQCTKNLDQIWGNKES